MNAVIAGSFKMLGRVIGENIQLHYVPQTDLEGVFMDPSQLDQILINLAVNARDAIVGTGQITLAATNRMLTAADCQGQVDFVTPGDYVVLSFRDDGSGMSPEVQAHIFEPFFTTKGVGKGTGLGLATVYGIVKQNHGAILVQSALGQGTTFTLYLPRAKTAALATAEAGTQQLPKGTETVLVTEDEKAVLKLIQRTLEQQGYNVLAAETPELALQVCAQHQETIHLLLTDVIMPSMNGKELSEHIQKLRPGIRVLFMSGYSADILEQMQASDLPTGLQVLQKPFTALSLAQHVRAILDHSTPAPEET